MYYTLFFVLYILVVSLKDITTIIVTAYIYKLTLNIKINAFIYNETVFHTINLYIIISVKIKKIT